MLAGAVLRLAFRSFSSASKLKVEAKAKVKVKVKAKAKVKAKVKVDDAEWPYIQYTVGKWLASRVDEWSRARAQANTLHSKALSVCSSDAAAAVAAAAAYNVSATGTVAPSHRRNIATKRANFGTLENSSDSAIAI